MSTGIEWTDETWNPVTGCTKVSPGCDNCYALTLAERFRGTPGHYFENGFDVQLRPDKLIEPLKWRKPRRIFVNSMSDLFHQDVPGSYIAQVWATMAATPQHTYQVLTKRHGRMRSLLSNPYFRKDVMGWLRQDGHPIPAWPLPNVWLGVSVEDQKRADRRIPALLETPAAVRFLSCEPLLGPVDLTKWLPPISPMDPTTAPKSWSDWTWPDWVPQTVRDQIESFWGPKSARTPQQWMRDMHVQGSHPFGTTVTSGDGFGHNPPQVTGRWVHAWNNVGRLVHDDGSFSYTSFSQRAIREQRRLNWIICGGESGPKSRPMHPDWARNLRDQCLQANVPFFFKQWGNWAPPDPEHGNSVFDYVTNDDRVQVVNDHGVRLGRPWPGWRVQDGTRDAAVMRRYAKHAAGRLLDGRTWDQYPQQHESREKKGNIA
ncbi:DUF5131 family protein [Saccharopolyspora pogona]|uniref:DUF5131 family protein n=1 Tax=Saccharopolyspora pogona TaxID=333966 RepID=UPI001681D8F8|nr:phage Gp37/Gp68 family protein [Saccharopolyspora pogona]